MQYFVIFPLLLSFVILVYAVVQQVLNIKLVSVFNTIVCPDGKIFVQNPSSVLGFDASEIKQLQKPRLVLVLVLVFFLLLLMFP